MRNGTGLTQARQQYAAAHAAHYETKDLGRALELYKGVLAAHPDTQEAGYSRSQILNIIKEVVPERELFEAQVSMAVARFGGLELQPGVSTARTEPCSRRRIERAASNTRVF